jgi:peptide-methionine (R)-S-oxide reductase
MLTRRAATFLTLSAVLAAPRPAAAAFEVTLTEREWRRRLTRAQYAILRGHETEDAFTGQLRGERSALLHEKRTGTYRCAGCALPAYSSRTKFDSGTGWPSFWQALTGATGTSIDQGFLSTLTEVHCRRCGGHFGHIFEDPATPSGQRHCLNGLALTFVPA